VEQASEFEPRRWAELRNLIKSRRDRFNQEIGYEALSWEAQGQSFSITRDLDGAVLEGVYDPVSCFGALTSEKLQIDRKINAVIIDDDVQFCTNPEDDDPLRREPGHRRIRLDDNTGSEVEKLEEIAERLITDFLSF